MKKQVKFIRHIITEDAKKPTKEITLVVCYKTKAVKR